MIRAPEGARGLNWNEGPVWMLDADGREWGGMRVVGRLCLLIWPGVSVWRSQYPLSGHQGALWPALK